MYIRRNLTPAEASHVMDLEVPGLIAESESQRYYPGGEAGHIALPMWTAEVAKVWSSRLISTWRRVRVSVGLIDRERDAIRYLPGGSDGSSVTICT